MGVTCMVLHLVWFICITETTFSFNYVLCLCAAFIVLRLYVRMCCMCVLFIWNVLRTTSVFNFKALTSSVLARDLSFAIVLFRR